MRCLRCKLPRSSNQQITKETVHPYTRVHCALFGKVKKMIIPQHIAIIMDGNGRWAKARGKVRTAGHEAGAETLKNIVRAADALGVKVLTVYAFSTENWQRPKLEVDFIMNLLGIYLVKELPEFMKENVQVRFIGARQELPKGVIEKLDKVLHETGKNTGIVLNLAINYGAQRELVDAVKAIATEVQQGRVKIEDISEKLIEENLYTAGLPMPDLLIRTGGDLRVSNFLLWQIAYAEIWTTEAYWPDFTPEMLEQAIEDFNGRERRFGGLGE